MKVWFRSSSLAAKCRCTSGEPTSKSHLPDSSSRIVLANSGNAAPISSLEIARPDLSSADACAAVTYGTSPLERDESVAGGNSMTSWVLANLLLVPHAQRL